MARQLPADYVASDDELVMGEVYLAAMALNEKLQAAGAVGLTVAISHGYRLNAPEVYVDAARQHKVQGVWMEDQDGERIPMQQVIEARAASLR